MENTKLVFQNTFKDLCYSGSWFSSEFAVVFCSGNNV